MKFLLGAIAPWSLAVSRVSQFTHTELMSAVGTSDTSLNLLMVENKAFLLAHQACCAYCITSMNDRPGFVGRPPCISTDMYVLALTGSGHSPCTLSWQRQTYPD
jgi:hypothetical protein